MEEAGAMRFAEANKEARTREAGSTFVAQQGHDERWIAGSVVGHERFTIFIGSS